MAKTLKELLDQYGHTRIGDADMALGRDNPGALEQILQERQNWANATTQAERDAAHNRAENIRKAYGQYSGGVEGMDGQYKPTYQKPAAAAENDNVMALYEKFNNLYGKTNAPTWTPQYQEQIGQILGDITNRDPFEYKMTEDPLYQQYRDQYVREGQKAMRDSAAQAAAMTGGYGSTYGAIAAQQGYDNYLAQLNDRVPQLEQMAYGKYADNLADMYNQLGAYQSEENRLYGQYLDDLGQYNADRDFAFNAMQAAMGQNNYENEFDRGVFESDRDYNMADKQLAIELALSTGDYSALKEMGIDTGMLDLEQTLAKAQAQAALGKLQGTTATGKGSSGNSGGGNSGGGNNKSGSYEITNQQNDEEVYIPGLRWVGNLSLKKMLETGEVVAEVNGNKITYKKAR
ncbi:MAG: hypothetical protein IKU91_07050 [Anaerotignum sp.]|nr:hypothetical protein [Anaerotignum sp.]